jgi:para-nitrobenzyl esterase
MVGLLGLAANAQDYIYATTEYGAVKGIKGEAGVWSKVPYAAPPVGPLRLRDPQPPTPWNDTYDASGIAPPCPQLKLDGDLLMGLEDCLYLRVTVPASLVSSGQLRSDGGNLPVMAFMYGGGWVIGDSVEALLYDAANLANKYNVIVVTPNYRLGSLGWLALPELAAESSRNMTGNYGLLDQQFALQWIQRNIEAFGGDPSHVLLFGESAGGFSVCAHLAMESSRGLFSAAAMESGSCDSPQFFRDYNKSVAFSYEFATAIGCSEKGPALLECLRSRSTEDMIKSILDWLNPNWPFTGADNLDQDAVDARRRDVVERLKGAPLKASPGLASIPEASRPTWMPVFAPVMPWSATVGTGDLQHVPLWYIRNGDWAKVPWIAGTNLNEASILAPLLPLVVHNTSFAYDDADTVRTLQQLFSSYKSSPTALAQAVNATLLEYPLGAYPDGFWRLSMLFTHYFFSCGTRRSIRAAATQDVPTYLYSFQHKLSWLFGLVEDLFGDFHSSELPFVFDNQWPLIIGAFNEADKTVAEAFGTFWTNMARGGSPNAANDGQPNWPQYNATDDISMTFAAPLYVETGYVDGLCDFWDHAECILDPQGASCPTAPFPH